MKRYYPAIIEKDEGSDYGISFPDFLGCVSAGDTVEDAFRMGTEALNIHIAGMVEDGDYIPEPTHIEDIKVEADINVVCIMLIPVYLPGKARRINITLDENLIEQIDAVASNRSAFLAEAARARLSTG